MKRRRLRLGCLGALIGLAACTIDKDYSLQHPVEISKNGQPRTPILVEL